MQGQTYIRPRGSAGIGNSRRTGGQKRIPVQGKVIRAGKPVGHNFLTEKFIATERHLLPVEVSEKDYRFLVASAKRYAASRSKKLRIVRSKDKVSVLASIYEQLEKMLDKGHSLDFFHDDENGGLYFVINRWLMDEGTVYFVPFKFTYYMKDSTLALLTRRFIATFAKVNGWESVYEQYLFEMIKEERQWDYDKEDYDADFISYFDGGIAEKRINEMAGMKALSAKELLDFTPHPEDKELYDCLVKGLEYINPEHPYNMFGNCWSECYFRDWNDESNEMEDNLMIEPIDSLFSVVYDKDDSMTETLISYISSACECGDSVQDILCEQHSLSPDKDVEFNSAIPCLIDYIVELVSISEKYEMPF